MCPSARPSFPQSVRRSVMPIRKCLLGAFNGQYWLLLLVVRFFHCYFFSCVLPPPLARRSTRDKFELSFGLHRSISFFPDFLWRCRSSRNSPVTSCRTSRRLGTCVSKSKFTVSSLRRIFVTFPRNSFDLVWYVCCYFRHSALSFSLVIVVVAVPAVLVGHSVRRNRVFVKHASALAIYSIPPTPLSPFQGMTHSRVFWGFRRKAWTTASLKW